MPTTLAGELLFGDRVRLIVFRANHFAGSDEETDRVVPVFGSRDELLQQVSGELQAALCTKPNQPSLWTLSHWIA